MNETTKIIISAVSGLTVGIIGGVFGTKKYFEKKLDEECSKYRAKLEEYYGKREAYRKVEEMRSEDNSFERDEESEKEARKEYVRNRDQKEKTNYKDMYKGLDHLMNEETENTEIEDEDDVERDDVEETTPEEKAFERQQKNKGRKPRIISTDEYSSLDPSIDQQCLFYYTLSDVLCDENEEPIDDPALFVGDALDKYNFKTSDERVIFVMNYDLDTCYEIQKLDAELDMGYDE